MISIKIKVPKIVWRIIEKEAEAFGITPEKFIRSLIDQCIDKIENDIGYVHKTIGVNGDQYMNLLARKYVSNCTFSDVVNAILLKWLLGGVDNATRFDGEEK